jgi:hypothetical protein
MPWTLQLSSTTQSLEAWGLSKVRVTLKSFQPSTLSFRLATDFDAASSFIYGAQVTLRDPNDVIRFTGRIRQRPASAAGTEEQQSYVAEDILGDLNRRMMRQDWTQLLVSTPTAVSTPLTTLFFDREEREAIAATISRITARAISIGVSMQVATLPTLAQRPRVVDMRGATLLECLRAVARFVPDLSTRVDYTTTPPTLSFIRRTAATEHDLAVIESAEQFEIAPLDDQQISAVVLTYERRKTVSGDTFNEGFKHRYPVDATGDEENALVIHTELRGATSGDQSSAGLRSLTQSQYIETSAIDPSDEAWWALLWPDIANAASGFTLTDDEIVGSPAQTKMITAGAQPAWTGSAATVEVRALFNGLIAGQPWVNKRLVARVNASTLNTGTYTKTTDVLGEDPPDDPGEEVPDDISQLLYDGLNPLQWQGRHVRTTDELSDWTIKPGDLVNFTGTANSDLETARATVQSVTYDIDSATRSIEFGSASPLQFADLIELLKPMRTLTIGTRAAEAAGTGTPTDITVEGAGMGPGASLVPTEDNLAEHAFQVRMIGTTGNSFRVEAGQIDGQTIAAATVDVGGSRPVSLIILPQYTLGIYNSQHVHSLAIKTGEDAPVLDTVAGTASDVTLVTSAGDEARVVIAVIAAGNAISQIAHGNILTTWADDGSLDGQAQLAFNKQA